MEDTQDMIAELEGRTNDNIDKVVSQMQGLEDQLSALDEKLETSVGCVRSSCRPAP